MQNLQKMLFKVFFDLRKVDPLKASVTVMPTIVRHAGATGTRRCPAARWSGAWTFYRSFVDCFHVWKDIKVIRKSIGTLSTFKPESRKVPRALVSQLLWRLRLGGSPFAFAEASLELRKEWFGLIVNADTERWAMSLGVTLRSAVRD